MEILIDKIVKFRLSIINTLLKTNNLNQVTFKVESRLLHIYGIAFTGCTIYTTIVLPKSINIPIEFTTLSEIVDLLSNMDGSVFITVKDREIILSNSDINLHLPTIDNTYTLEDARYNIRCLKFEYLDAKPIMNMSRILDSLKDKSFEKYILLKGNSNYSNTGSYALETTSQFYLLNDYIINYYMLPSLKRISKANNLMIGGTEDKTIFRISDLIYLSFDKLELNVDSILSYINTEFVEVNQIDIKEWNKINIFNIWEENLPTMTSLGNKTYITSGDNSLTLNSLIQAKYNKPIIINKKAIDIARNFTTTTKPIFFYNIEENIVLITNETKTIKVVFRGEET